MIMNFCRVKLPGSVQSNTFFLNLKQRTVVKVVENELRYIKMYAAGVSVKTERKFFKNVEEQVIRFQSKVWSDLQCF